MAKCLAPRLIKVKLSAHPDSVHWDAEQNKFIKDDTFEGYVPAKCGKCVNCQVNSARQKAARFVTEWDTYPSARAFLVTLTFAGTPPKSRERLSLPLKDKRYAGQKYRYPAYELCQNYHKRLRKYGFEFSFLSLEEVGDEGRLHFHELWLLKNPDRLNSLPSRIELMKLRKTKQDFYDWTYNVMADVVSHEKVNGFNTSHPPDDELIRLRAFLRYVVWKLGKVTVDVIDNAGGAVRYCTSYATTYAITYAKDKNLKPPVIRTSKLADKFYKTYRPSIANGSLRTLSLGNGYSVAMPRYRLAKYRDVYDRLDDFLSVSPNLLLNAEGLVVLDKFKNAIPVDGSLYAHITRDNYNRVMSSIVVDMPDFDMPDFELIAYKHYLLTLQKF